MKFNSCKFSYLSFKMITLEYCVLTWVLHLAAVRTQKPKTAITDFDIITLFSPIREHLSSSLAKTFYVSFYLLRKLLLRILDNFR